MPAPQLTAFGVQVPSFPPSGGAGAQHALVMVIQPPASPPHGTTPGLLGSPPSGRSLDEPLSAASVPPPSLAASPPSPALPPLLLMPPLEELPLLLLLDELAPPLLLLLLDELESPLELPFPLLPPLPLLPIEESGRPLLGELPDELHCERTNGDPTAMANPRIHTSVRPIAVLLGAVFRARAPLRHARYLTNTDWDKAWNRKFVAV